MNICKNHFIRLLDEPEQHAQSRAGSVFQPVAVQFDGIAGILLPDFIDPGLNLLCVGRINLAGEGDYEPAVFLSALYHTAFTPFDRRKNTCYSTVTTSWKPIRSNIDMIGSLTWISFISAPLFFRV